MDLSDLLGTSGGLLNQQQQQGSSNSDILQSMGAAMMRAAGPSQFKHTTLSGLGDAMAAGVAARRSSQDDALKRTLVSGQINQQNIGQRLEIFKAVQPYLMSGEPLPPQLQALMHSIGGGVAPSVGGAMGQASAGGIGAGPPQAAPGPPGAAPQAMPGMPGAAPQAMPGPGGANAVTSAANDMHLNKLPLFGNFGAITDITKGAIADHLKATDPALEENERRKKIMEGDVARSDKLYPALVSLGSQGAQAKQDSDLSKSLATDPGFYSGSGQKLNEAWKKLQVAFGGDPNAAFSQEAFRKITASNVNTQIGEMKTTAAEMGGAAGRIFQNQTVLMEKASQSLDNSPAANRFLAELQGRAADMNVEVSKMAIQYKKQHGYLDAGFDEKLNDYTQAHPLFTREELGSLRKIATPNAGGAPAAPPAPGGIPQVPGGSPAPPANAPAAPVIINPKTGKRMTLVNGNWAPVNGQ